METNIIGKRIIELREQKGMTQANLADKLNIQRAALNYYEKGTRIPKTEIIIALALEFGVASDYLLGLQDAKYNKNEAVTRKLGLSDESIEVLESYNSAFPDVLVPAINILLRQVHECKNPSGLSFPSVGPFINDDGSVEQMTADEEAEAVDLCMLEVDDWYDGYYSTVMGTIDRFFGVELTFENDSELEIRQSGAFGKKEDMANFNWNGKHRWDDLFLVKTVSKNDLIEKTLVDDIERAIKNLRIEINTKNIIENTIFADLDDKDSIEWAMKLPKPQELPSDLAMVNEQLKKVGIDIQLVDGRYSISDSSGFFSMNIDEVEILKKEVIDCIEESAKDIIKKHRLSINKAGEPNGNNKEKE